jgi:hypothetical protein
MKAQVSLVLLAVGVGSLASVGMPTVEAKAQIKQCSVAPPSNARGHWSWRRIDGRKCWYSGRAAIPKSSLRWAVAAPAQVKADAAPVIIAKEKRSDPMDAQARLLDTDNTFESRWRARVSSEYTTLR